MGQTQLRVIGREPDKIVPVTTLDPALPLAAENSMHLAGQEIGQAERPDRERNRPEVESGLTCLTMCVRDDGRVSQR